VVDQIDPLPPECPRCRLPLEQHVHENEEVDLCRQCGGLWLDRRDFKRATRESSVYRNADLDKEFVRTPPNDPMQYIPCVRCGQVMNRKNFARISGVIIDECTHHGVWLDAGEMEKIRLFIADGGLEQAQDKKIEANRVELKALASKVDQVAFSHKLIHFWNVKRWLFGG
jgi:Zn-finger nucleic acid-binding protein